MRSPLFAAIERFAPRTALIEGDRRWTFDELGRDIRRVAAGLAERLAPGRRVVIHMTNRAEFVILQAAVEAPALVRVPVNSRSSAFELQNVVDDCAADAVFFDRSTAEHMATLRDGPWLCCVDEPTSEHGKAWGDLIRTRASDVPRATELDDLASINYTSGTLTRPKGVMLSHRAWRSVYRNMLIDRDIRGTDVLAHVGPLSHASGTYLVPFMLRGATNVIVEGGRVEHLFPTIERFGVTAFSCVPTVLTRLVAQSHDHDLSTLRWIGYGAEPMPANTLRAALERFGPILTQNYGLTEAMMTCAFQRMSDHVDGHGRLTGDGPSTGCIGRPYTFVELEVHDPDGRAVADGEIGELAIRSEHVMSGYWQMPEQTADVLRDGWLRSGDLARRVGGLFYLAGRSKDMLISGGFNIYPAEIEQCLGEVRGVREAAVIGVADADFGERALAFVVPASGHQLTTDALIAALRPRLGFKTPRSWEFIGELPRTQNGKVDKAALRARVQASA